MEVKIIKTQAEHDDAMARLKALMALDPSPDSPEENELELLALVIEDYETRTIPPVVPDPVEQILFRMDQMGLSRKDMIPYFGSISKVSEVLSRKRPLSLSMIRRLNEGLGIPAAVLIQDAAGRHGERYADRAASPQALPRELVQGAEHADVLPCMRRERVPPSTNARLAQWGLCSCRDERRFQQEVTEASASMQGALSVHGRDQCGNG